MHSDIELECPACNTDDPDDFRNGCEDPWHVEAGRAETDCRCNAAGSEDCPCEAGGSDGLCACCRDGDHRGSCFGPLNVTTRSRRDDRYQSRYILAGARGAVEFHKVHWPRHARGHGLAYGTPFFEYHSPRPHRDGQVPEPWPCAVLEGPCYAAGEPSPEASDLSVNHTVSGRDDRIIWRELERRYTEWEAEG